MNKRIRKKQLKRTLRNMLSAYSEYEAACERIWREALRDVVDAYGESKEVFYTAFRRYMEVASILASNGLLSKFLTEYGHEGPDAKVQVNLEMLH